MSPEISLDDYLSISTIVERKGMTRYAVKKAIASGELKSVYVQRQHYVLESDVRKWNPKRRILVRKG